MSRRETATLAIGAFAFWLALEATGLVFLALTREVSPGGNGDPPISSIRDAAIAGVFATVGLLLATRLPRNAIGWLFLAVALSLASTLVLVRYALYAVVAHPGSLPGGLVAASLGQSAWVLLISSIALLLLLFPQGHLPSRRWRPVVVVLVASVAATSVGMTTMPGALQRPFEAHRNPLGVDALETADRALSFAWVAMLVVLVAGGISLVRRFRRSEGIERQQYMLFTTAALVLPVALVLTQTIDAAHGNGADQFVSWAPSLVSALLPIATAIAILRYRLYEIDRLVSRTLVYGALTVILGAAYVALVLVGQAVFSSFAGGSNLAIAASTLVVAALFLPVRARVQRFVDRRFYRSRYDAHRTLEAFGARLREQVELARLQEDLRGVVGETMQPAHVSVWLRESAR